MSGGLRNRIARRRGLRDRIAERRRAETPPPEPVAEAEPLAEPESPSVTHEFGQQYRVRQPFEATIRQRFGPAGWNRRITDGGGTDHRREQARQAGYGGDVLFPPE